jgi:D-sedoheptulose 7-phosphate isomerase
MEAAVTKLLLFRDCAGVTEEIAHRLIGVLRRGGRIWLFGNGGSAADAQHIAAELEGRFRRDRRPFPAVALTTNTSTLTAVSNDIGFEHSFARLVRAHVRRGDAVVAISTSGRSRNVVDAAREARRIGAVVIGLTGRSASPLARWCDVVFRAPSDETARIQECHITVGHIVCEAIEAELGRRQ